MAQKSGRQGILLCCFTNDPVIESARRWAARELETSLFVITLMGIGKEFSIESENNSNVLAKKIEIKRSLEKGLGTDVILFAVETKCLYDPERPLREKVAQIKMGIEIISKWNLQDNDGILVPIIGILVDNISRDTALFTIKEIGRYKNNKLAMKVKA